MTMCTECNRLEKLLLKSNERILKLTSILNIIDYSLIEKAIDDIPFRLLFDDMAQCVFDCIQPNTIKISNRKLLIFQYNELDEKDNIVAIEDKKLEKFVHNVEHFFRNKYKKNIDQYITNELKIIGCDLNTKWGLTDYHEFVDSCKQRYFLNLENFFKSFSRLFKN